MKPPAKLLNKRDMRNVKQYLVMYCIIKLLKFFLLKSGLLLNPTFLHVCNIAFQKLTNFYGARAPFTFTTRPLVIKSMLGCDSCMSHSLSKSTPHNLFIRIAAIILIILKRLFIIQINSRHIYNHLATENKHA